MARWWEMVLFNMFASLSRKCIKFMRMESNCFKFFTCASEVTNSHFIVDAYVSVNSNWIHPPPRATPGDQFKNIAWGVGI